MNKKKLKTGDLPIEGKGVSKPATNQAIEDRAEIIRELCNKRKVITEEESKERTALAEEMKSAGLEVYRFEDSEGSKRKIQIKPGKEKVTITADKTDEELE